jgi:hypothetical protein
MTTPSSDLPVDDGDTVHVRITYGHAGDQALDVRITPESAPEMVALLEAEGVYAGEALEFSAAQELAILVASFGGGLTGLAAALRAFFQRNRHKHVKFSIEDGVEIDGFSTAEAHDFLDKALEEIRARQLKRDEEWRRLLNEVPEESGDDDE